MVLEAIKSSARIEAPIADDSPVPIGSLAVAFVCAGPSCRGDGRAKLCAVLLDAGLMIESSKCLGICEGPVAVAPIKDRWEVVEKLDGNRQRTRLVEAVTLGKPKRVRRSLVKGARRKKALRRVLKGV